MAHEYWDGFRDDSSAPDVGPLWRWTAVSGSSLVWRQAIARDEKNLPLCFPVGIYSIRRTGCTHRHDARGGGYEEEVDDA